MTSPIDRPHESEIQTLQSAASTVAAKAYAPYSGFSVGAALRLTNGALVTGANVENGSYGLTICAERSAVCCMIATHGPQARIAAICVTNLNNASSPPCGACRQALAEFAAPDAWIIFAGENSTEIVPFRDLLPFTFHLSPEHRAGQR